MRQLETNSRGRVSLLDWYYAAAPRLGDDLPARHRLRQCFLARNAVLLDEERRLWEELLYGEAIDDGDPSASG
jgi:hypothetical protein